jgi:hypothetical protein
LFVVDKTMITAVIRLTGIRAEQVDAYLNAQAVKGFANDRRAVAR